MGIKAARHRAANGEELVDELLELVGELRSAASGSPAHSMVAAQPGRSSGSGSSISPGCVSGHRRLCSPLRWQRPGYEAGQDTAILPEHEIRGLKGPIMRKYWASAFVAIVAVSVAMASPAGAKKAPSTTTTTIRADPKVTVLTAAQITPALLALTDMPAGWATSPQGSVLAPGTQTGGICNGPDAQSRAIAAGGGGAASSAFYKDAQVGPIISEEVYGFPTVKAATTFMAANQAAITGCPAGWDLASPVVSGGTEHFLVSELSADKIGDQSSRVERRPRTCTTGRPVRRPRSTSCTRGSATTSSTRTTLCPVVTWRVQHLTQKAFDKFGVLLQQAKKTAPTTTTTTKKKK